MAQFGTKFLCLRAQAAHGPAIADLIFTHGPNAWNWLPEEGVKAHVQDIVQGRAHAVLAFDDADLIGAVTFCLTDAFKQYQSPQRADAQHGYVCEAVVRRDQAGRGLGVRLLRQAIDAMWAMGVQEIYIDRHEENAASAGMMRKAGFEAIATFAEPQRRPHGSGRTTVCLLQRKEPHP